MIESWVIHRLNPLNDEKANILADPGDGGAKRVSGAERVAPGRAGRRSGHHGLTWEPRLSTPRTRLETIESAGRR